MSREQEKIANNTNKTDSLGNKSMVIPLFLIPFIAFAVCYFTGIIVPNHSRNFLMAIINGVPLYFAFGIPALGVLWLGKNDTAVWMVNMMFIFSFTMALILFF